MKNVVVGLAVAFLAIGCGNPSQKRSDAPASANPTQAEKPTAKIPSDVTYSILKAETTQGTFRRLVVRISKRVPEDVLAAVARELKSKDAGDYRLTTILYLLPDMEVDSGAVWARTSFKPDLEIKILGMSDAQEADLRKVPTDVQKQAIGAWIVQQTQSRILIYSQNGKILVDETFTDGSVNTKEVVEQSQGKSRRFQERRPRDGEYWLIEPSGDLGMYDKDGLFLTAKKVVAGK